MEKKTLVPRTIINVEGKLIYNENFQAWNTIRLKKEIFNEFPQLKEKRSAFSYKMIYYRNLEEFEKFVKDLKKKNEESLPVLMFLYKEPEK
ncbi:MAG: hypothetical protein AABW56_04105 [Nanoarchaeota archaeon]